MPVAALSPPAGVGRSVVCPRTHRNAWERTPPGTAGGERDPAQRLGPGAPVGREKDVAPVVDGDRLVPARTEVDGVDGVDGCDGQSRRRSLLWLGPHADIFVTTKLWLSDYGYDSTHRAFDASLHRLGLDHVDLYLLHWPVPADFDATVDSYQAAEKILADGQARAIGVSNFGPRHLADLLDRTDVVPAVNQVELHPFFTQPDVRAADAAHGIVTQSWSPIGGVLSNHPAGPGTAVRPIGHPTVTSLAARYGRTPAQVVLRWHVQHGLSAIPKSVRAHRIAENIDIFDRRGAARHSWLEVSGPQR